MDLCELKKAPQAVARHPWELSRRDFVLDWVDSLAQKRPLHRILDLGCGDVFIGGELARRLPDTRIDAVDRAFSPSIIARLESDDLPGNLSLASALNELDTRDNPIDLVLLLDVLEHVEQDAELLREIATSAILASHASLLVTVPAFPLLFCSHDRLLGHHRRYRLGSLKRLVSAAGFSIETCGYAYLSGFWFRAARALFERVRILPPLRQTEITTWRRGPLATRLANTVLRYDLRLSVALANSPVPMPGLSCYLLCRKLA